MQQDLQALYQINTIIGNLINTIIGKPHILGFDILLVEESAWLQGDWKPLL